MYKKKDKIKNKKRDKKKIKIRKMVINKFNYYNKI